MITPDEVSAWSDDELRVKIAEALGWTRIALGNVFVYVCALNMENMRGSLPDWPRDLNAAAELSAYTGECGYLTTIYQMHDNGRASSWSVLIEKINADESLVQVMDIKCIPTEPRARSEAFYLFWLASKGSQS